MMELKRIVSMGIMVGLCWLGISESTRAQEVAKDTNVVEEQIQVEIMADSTVPEALVRERLAKLENVIPLRYHKVTHQFVEYFIYRKPSFVKRMLEQMHLYFPLYEQMLEKYEMPRELKFLSLIESGLNPRIISYAGAGGLWQFMPATGREYGMKQDDYIDERFDPAKSTEAACKYLKRLHRAFGDWEMALAAYNVGPGNVKRAMRRSGSSTFWGIYNFLPKQTRHYVPQFVAMTYLMHYHADHGIFPETPDYPMLFDTIQVSGYFNLHTFAKLSNISLDEFYKLNPQVINTELPATTKEYMLKVPSHNFDFFRENRVAIWDSASKSPFQSHMLLAGNESDVSDSVLAIKKVGGLVAAGDENEDPETIITRQTRKVYHTVRRGETLGKIASRYGVDTYDLKRWNHLRGNNIVRGKRLVLYKETTKHAGGQVTASSKGKIKMRYHRVQPGDTLSTIAERYGINVSRLKKINRLKGNTVRKGQKLIIG
jgi:membrane-bound lytic murein transglycosylase D